MQQNKQYYNDFFTKYPVDIHDSAMRFLAVTKLLKGKVLDVACGTGTLSKYYTGDYVGADISDIAIKKAQKERRSTAQFGVFDFTTKVIADKQEFDCVYLGEFLEHIENDDQVFENVLSALKPNGRIVVSVPNGDRVPDESHCRIFTVPQIRRDYSKYGKITFHKWEGFSNRLLFTIDINQKNEDEICLVMIVKDEQKGLEKAIISALPIVDRVVISVDTKSQDKTEEIAKLYADELKFHEWHDDFSEARNFAQENVKSKWILFLDGHEFIESYGDFKDKIKIDVEGIFVTIRMESGMTFLFPRIYRSFIKFKNKVHNINTCTTRRFSPNFVIVHDRLGGQDEDAINRRNEQRENMLPKELNATLKEDPKNARAHFHFANYYMMRKKTDLAMKHYKANIKYSNSPDERYLSLLHYGALHEMKGNHFRALWNFNKADELLPNRWETARVIGGFYFSQKNFKKAIDYLMKALSKNSRRYSYQPMQVNRSSIWDMIAHSFAKLDENQKAVIAWERAIEQSEDEQEKKLFKQKINLVKTLV